VHPREVLGGWGLIPDRVRRISAGGNVHWRVDCGIDAFVLRGYRAGHAAASIQYELDVLAHLGARGWPAAAPIGGVRWLEGAAFVLFPLLPGRARLRETDRHRRDRGRILAELHRDLGSLTRRSCWTGPRRPGDRQPPSLPGVPGNSTRPAHSTRGRQGVEGVPRLAP
jgi:Phosphotransferase enzyme family